MGEWYDQPHTLFIITMMMLSTSRTMVAIIGKFELFLGTQNCAKSFTPVVAFSPHKDPQSLEYWVAGCALGGLESQTRQRPPLGDGENGVDKPPAHSTYLSIVLVSHIPPWSSKMFHQINEVPYVRSQRQHGVYREILSRFKGMVAHL